MTPAARARPVLVALAVFVAMAVAFAPDAVTGEGVFWHHDLRHHHYPWRAWAASVWASGSVPWWASGAGNGFPLLAEGEGGFRYPPTMGLFRLLPDPLPAAGSATSAASYAARHKGAGDRTTQHHRLSKLEPLGLDPSDGATLIKGTASLWRHFIAPEAAIRSSAAAAATAAAAVVASSPGESRLDTLRERARAATAPKSAADALGPQGNSRRLGSGTR